MPSSQGDSQFVLVGRAIWMMFGPIAMFTTAAAMLTTGGSGWKTVPSLIYLAALLSAVLGRWLECASGQPLDTTGKPIETSAVTRWSVMTLFLGGAAWLAIHVVNHFLSK